MVYFVEVTSIRTHSRKTTKSEKHPHPDFVLNFDLLTSGTPDCNTEQHKDIILAVLRYIKYIQRFN